jgi:hypothetical protein
MPETDFQIQQRIINRLISSGWQHRAPEKDFPVTFIGRNGGLL